MSNGDEDLEDPSQHIINDKDNDGIRDDHEDAGKISEEQQEQYNNRAKQIRDNMKPLGETWFGDVLQGENRVGRTIHSVLDVAPIPNFHEVIKAVIKDGKKEGRALSSFDILKESFSRLDWLRTGSGVLIAGAVLLGYIDTETASTIWDAVVNLF